MGAMKAIYTDIQELQIAAERDEDSFISYVEEMGWTSPTEKEIQTAKASKMLATMGPAERTAALRILEMVGLRIPALDFPMKSAPVALGEHASAA